ncbi:MAG: hypothetical protein GY816_02905 [Cytophagales bacterium]|nr:hypothetical protein [Cytophagales bacterium]
MDYLFTNEDLIQHLKEQLYFLDSSLSYFSRHTDIVTYKNKVLGKAFHAKLRTEVEAKRLALIIRILLHDTSSSKSLLNHLDIKDQIKYYNTASPNDGRLHSMTGMSGVRGSNSSQYFGLVAKFNTGNSLVAVPLFNQNLKKWYDGYQRLCFTDWWSKNKIMAVGGFEHTREDLVLNVANKDGGAHINKDGTLPEEYHVSKSSDLSLNINGIQTSFERNVVYASIAQIAWEVLNSIDED